MAAAMTWKNCIMKSIVTPELFVMFLRRITEWMKFVDFEEQ